MQLDIAPQEAYRAALGVALKRKWQLIDAHPPGGVRREGVIELVARTPIMGFRDDVVIRVAPSEDGARIDVRSASRYGTHDFGANAARIRSLLEDIDDAAGEYRPSRSRRRRRRRKEAGQAAAAAWDQAVEIPCAAYIAKFLNSLNHCGVAQSIF